MNTTNQTDLIAQRNSDYENLPGLILGLDGWILRSLPKNLRAQFINGYEKLLRTVFHPDRFQEPAAKASRQLYLQNVGEAVRFMLADEFSFEMTADTVPSRKNPMLVLREAISVRDGIISQIDERLDDQTSAARELRREVQELRHKILKVTADSERRSEIDFRLKHIVRAAVRQFPVPIGIKYSQVNGRFMGFSAESALVHDIAHYSSKGMLFEDHTWIDSGSWTREALKQGLLGQQVELDLKRTTAKDKHRNYSVIGAMTIAHLCEFIRGFHSYPAELTSDQVMVAMDWLLAPINEREGKSSFRIKTHPYLLPFYNPGMLLLVLVRDRFAHERDSKPPYHQLLLVDDVDAGEGPAKALVDGLERENKNLLQKNMAHFASIVSLRKKLNEAQAEIKRLTPKKKLTPPSSDKKELTK